MSAADIARTAYQQALAAAERERQAEEDRKAEEKRQKEAEHQEVFDAALPILENWFPGVKWNYSMDGDFGYDTIVWDAGVVSPSFKLRVVRRLIDMNVPAAGYRVEIEVGDYRPDSSMPGYSYFSGIKVKSPADIGRYLAGKRQ